MRAVADTGPLNYLVMIGAVDVLPEMFATVAIPFEVRAELDRAGTPPMVRAWIGNAPGWLHFVATTGDDIGPDLRALDVGEHAAIRLALGEKADLLLMDDRAGVAAARSLGLAVTGTLGVMDRAARRGLLDLRTAIAALQATNFYVRPALVEALLAAHDRR